MFNNFRLFFLISLSIQILYAQLDVSELLGKIYLYDFKLSSHSSYFSEQNYSKEIPQDLINDIKLQIKNFNNLDKKINENNHFKMNYYDFGRNAGFSDQRLSQLSKENINISKEELLSSTIAFKGRMLKLTIVSTQGVQFFRADQFGNIFEDNRFNDHNSVRERNLNQNGIDFLIDYYNQIYNVDYQSNFGIKNGFDDLILNDIFGWNNNQLFYSRTELLIDISQDIINYYSYIDDQESYNKWMKKKFNLLMPIEIGITPFYKEENIFQCPKSCEINTLHSFYNESYDFFYFESILLNTISDIISNGVNTDYSNVDIANKLFSIHSTIDDRLEGKDGAYGDIDFINEELSKNPLQSPSILYNYSKLEKQEFKAIINLIIADIFLEYSFVLLQSGYVEDAILFLENGLTIFDSIPLQLVKNLSFEDSYIFEDYIEVLGNVQFLPFFFSMVGMNDLENLQKFDFHKNHNDVLRLAKNLKIDPMTVNSYRGMIALAENMRNILLNIVNEEGFNYSKSIKKLDNIFIKAGMNSEDAKELRNGMMMGLLSNTRNPKLKKKDIDNIIENYRNNISDESLRIENYIDFSSFLVLNSETFSKYYSENPLEIALSVATEGLQVALKDVDIYDIQNNPSFYSNHMYLINSYATIKSLIFDENFNQEEFFDQLVFEINIKDKIRDVLIEPDNRVNALSYFLNDNNTLELLNADIYDGIIYYDMNTRFGQNTNTILVYLLKPNREIVNDEYIWEIYRQLIILNDEETPFLYDINTGSSPGSIIERVNLFNSLIEKNIDVKNFQKGFHELLISPISDILNDLEPYTIPFIDPNSNQKNILIINDSHFSKIPFDALIDKEGNYFMDDFVVSYAKSLKSIQRTLNKHDYNNNFDINSNSSVIIGDIDYSNYNYKKFNFDNLIFSANELSNISKINPNSFMITKKEASESNIKDLRFEEINYLHFSTHGISNTYNYLESSIILVPDNENNGLLTFNEISNLNLSNIDLVFLSACETNVGKSIENIGSLTLNDAFIIGGAQSVISTLWMIDDQATSIFVDTFHSSNFIKKNQSYKYAPYLLNKTKHDFIDTYKEYNNPYYWSGFVSYGL